MTKNGRRAIRRHGRIFTDHKSPLGWFFTAEEEARAWEACQLSTQWFNEHFASISDRRMVITDYANYTVPRK